MNQKEYYEKFCLETYVPIFSYPWWMDTVCGEKNWDVYIVWQGTKMIAAMPYYMENRNGFHLITKAKLTQNNGIIYNYPDNQKYCSKLDMEERVINEICTFVDGLNIDKYEQQYHHSVTNWLPFFWNGYSQLVRYTYVIDDTSNMECIYQNFSSKLRNKIKNALKIITITEDIEDEDFYTVNKMSFDKRGSDIPFDLDFYKKLNQNCKKHHCGKALAAIDQNGHILSVAYLVWDSQAVYYLLNGTNPKYRNLQANTVLIYEGIKLASKLNLKFDFEGSVIQSIERAYREYGAVQKSYFRIFKIFNTAMDPNLVNKWSN